MAKLLTLQCTVTKGTQEYESNGTGLECLDIQFQTTGTTTPKLSYVRFRNYYTHSIKIRQLMTLPSAPNPQWSTLLDLPLMKSPHHEDDAQKWHVIHVDDFIPGTYYPDQLRTLRVVLSQPSGLWKSAALQHLECFEEIHLGRECEAGVDEDDGNKEQEPRQRPVDKEDISVLEQATANSPGSGHNHSSSHNVGGGTGGTGGTGSSSTNIGSHAMQQSDNALNAFASQSMYNVASADSNFYRSHSTAVASLFKRTNELKTMIHKLQNCQRSKLGNPGSTLDFGAGAATMVKISK